MNIEMITQILKALEAIHQTLYIAIFGTIVQFCAITFLLLLLLFRD